MNKMKGLHMAAFVLVVVGAVNWGLVGMLNLDLVQVLFGSFPFLARLVYALVGASGVYLLLTHKDTCKVCGGK